MKIVPLWGGLLQKVSRKRTTFANDHQALDSDGFFQSLSENPSIQTQCRKPFQKYSINILLQHNDL